MSSSNHSNVKCKQHNSSLHLKIVLVFFFDTLALMASDEGWTTHTMALQARRTSSNVDSHVSISMYLLIKSIKLCIYVEEP